MVEARASTKVRTKTKPQTLREELLATTKPVGKAKGASAEPVDPEAVLTSIQSTIAAMDTAVDAMGDAEDRAQVRLCIEMGAAPEEVEGMVARQAATKVIKVAATVERPKAKAKTKGWKAPQDAQTRSKALQDGAPPAPESLQRCWECFPDLPPAGGFDWLGRGSAGEKDRTGQPMKRFLQPGPHRNFPTRQRSIIYIVPLGDARSAPPASTLAELLRRWFLLEVAVLKRPTAAALKALEWDERGSGYGPQIECPSAHQLLYSLRPRDAFVVLGYTMEDICNSAKVRGEGV